MPGICYSLKMTEYNSLLGQLWWFYQLAFDAVLSLYCRDLLEKKFKRNKLSSVLCYGGYCYLFLSLLLYASTVQFQASHEKTCFFMCENKDSVQLHVVNMQLIRAFVFCYISSTLPLLLKPELNEPSTCCSQLLRLYSPVCVRPDQKPRRHIFS